MRFKYLLLFGGVIVFSLLSNSAFAYKYNANAGCVPDNKEAYKTGGSLAVVPQVFGSANNSSNVPIPVQSNIVQYIWIGAGQLINDPTSVGGVTGDDQLTSSSGSSIGDDSDTGDQFSNEPGKFFHYFQYETASDINKFYIRIWDKDPTAADAKFGESEIFAVAYGTDTYVTPNNVGISNVIAQFPKESPADVINASAGAPEFNRSAIKWEVPISWNTSFNARKYEVYKIDDANKTNPSLLATINNTNGYPSTNNTEAKTWKWTGLNESTNYFLMIRAVNGFGQIESNVVSFTTAAYPDLTVPIAITDLRASVSGNSITLNWSAPYDTNKLNVLTPCNQYDIRVYSEPIIDVPQFPMPDQTNPGDLTNWDSATPIINFTDFSPSPIILPPKKWGENESLVINGSLAGTYYFAIKSKDESGNWSYISNVVGVTAGAAAAAAGVGPLNITSFYTYDDPSDPYKYALTYFVCYYVKSSNMEGKTCDDVLTILDGLLKTADPSGNYDVLEVNYWNEANQQWDVAAKWIDWSNKLTRYWVNSVKAGKYTYLTSAEECAAVPFATGAYLYIGIGKINPSGSAASGWRLNVGEKTLAAPLNWQP